MDINSNAPAIASAETLIHAPLDTVWSIQSNISDWGRWNPEVAYVDLRGPLIPGTEFRWKAGGVTITSILREIEPKRRLAWTGKTLGINAMHIWSFEKRGDNVLVRTEESFDGLLVRIFARSMQKMLASSLDKGLAMLKAECERA
jgi:hypothetical protein